jgi:hypothetical protein
VSRLRRLLALALVALWLPATLHCALEASDTPADACNLIEDASFKPANDTALLPPPALCAGLLRFVAPNPTLVLTPPPSGLSDRIEPPPEVARTWHFTARAALPSRAPSLA